MQLFRYTDVANRLESDAAVFPYPFLENYHAFERAMDKDPVLVYDTTGNSIPLVLQNRKGFIVGRCLYPPLRQGKRLSGAEEQVFLDELISFLKKNKICHLLEAPMPLDIYYSKPANATACKFGRYAINLQQQEEEIFSAFSANYRNEIRKTEQLWGVSIREGQEVFDDFYDLYSGVLKRQGLAAEAKFQLRQLFDSLLVNANLCCAVIYHNEKPQGTAFIPYTKYAAYYLYGGSVAEPVHPGILKYLHWHIVKELRKKGVNEYIIGGARTSNVAGTRYEGIQNFKARFGGQYTEGVLWKAEIAPMYAKVYDVMLNLKQLLKGQGVVKDIIDQEIDNGAGA